MWHNIYIYVFFFLYAQSESAVQDTLPCAKVLSNKHCAYIYPSIHSCMEDEYENECPICARENRSSSLLHHLSACLFAMYIQ